MGVALALGVADGVALLGLLFAVPAMILSWRNRRWRGLALAVLVFAFSLVPMALDGYGVSYIVKLRQLVLEE
jgi:hypothetical protein